MMQVDNSPPATLPLSSFTDTRCASASTSANASPSPLYTPEASHAATPLATHLPLSQAQELISTPHQRVDITEEILAVEALGQLRNSGRSTPLLEPEFGTLSTRQAQSTPAATESEQQQQGDDKGEYDEHNEDEDNAESFLDSNDSESFVSETSSSSRSSRRERLYHKMRNHPIVDQAVKVYKHHTPAIKYGVEIVESATVPIVNMIEQTRSEWKRKRRLSKANAMFPDDAKVDITSASSLSSFSLNSSKRQKLPSISEALFMGNRNWNEISMNMSIESKNRMQTCLQLLMLANKQLSSKVTYLQDVITKEHEAIQKKALLNKDNEDEENEVFHDAAEELPTEDTSEIKQEIVGTIKKVVSFISKYAGSSLPEPARTDVREELLRLPTKWSTQTSNVMTYNTNAKVLVLANESLEMVRSVMTVFDETLNKADLWVKQRQEKQLAKQAILNSTLQRQSATSASSTGLQSIRPSQSNDSKESDN